MQWKFQILIALVQEKVLLMQTSVGCTKTTQKKRRANHVASDLLSIAMLLLAQLAMLVPMETKNTNQDQVTWLIIVPIVQLDSTKTSQDP